MQGILTIDFSILFLLYKNNYPNTNPSLSDIEDPFPTKISTFITLKRGIQAYLAYETTSKRQILAKNLWKHSLLP